MGGIVNQAEENIKYQDQPISKMQTGNISKYWFKEPYYAARWTYFHRPSVWNRMAAQGTFDWYGLSGFKTLLAGEKGIGYGGGPRTIGRPSRWILNQGARGLEAVGKGFTKLSTRRYAMQMGHMLPIGHNMRYGTSKLLGTIGQRLLAAGQAYRVGGLGGAVSGLGWQRGGQLLQEVAGGTIVGPILPFTREGIASPYIYGPALRNKVSLASGTSNLRALSGLEARLPGMIAGETGTMGLFRPGKVTERIIGAMTAEERTVLTATGNIGRNIISTRIRYAAAARLMGGVSVGLNIALFGGMLAKLGYAGARRLAEESWDLKMNRSAYMLEFGAGLNPYPFAGASTERQRSISAIQESHINGRMFMGQEAALMSDSNY